ncbi:TIM barrel protein [Actinokineospora sp. 24-640]
MPRWTIACHEQLLPAASLAEKWSLAQALGFDGIELDGALGARLPELATAAADGAVVSGVSIEAGAGGVDALARVSGDLAAIAALGTGIAVTLPVEAVAPDHAGVGDPALVGGLRELAEAAGREGALVCLRPLNRYEGRLLHTLDQAVALCRAVDHPALRVAACTFDMNIEEADPPRALLEAGPWLGKVHLADSNAGVPGAGHLDWWAALAALAAAGYPGWLVVTGRPSGPAGSALPAALSLLRQAGG